MAQPKLPANIVLPQGLQYIKGRQGRYTLYFESDVDKSTYFLGRTGTTVQKGSGSKNKNLAISKKKKEVWEWLSEVTGWSEAQRREHREVILEEVRKLSNSVPPAIGEIEVPALYKDKQLEDILSILEEDEDEEDDEELIPMELFVLLNDLSKEEPAAKPKKPKKKGRPKKPVFDFPGYSYSQFLEQYPEGTSKKPKKSRAKSGTLTKNQEDLLQKILEDLINIRHRLVEIKKAQDDKVAYEKRRDRLQAERLAFLERERQIEALPQATPDTSTAGKTASQREERKKQTEKSFTERLAESARNIFNVSLISGLGGMVFGGGGSPQTQQQPQQANSFDYSQAAKSALKVAPIPGISMIPFADGGTITPLGSPSSGGAAVRPLEASMRGTSGGTTFSRGFSMEDLKSPLADVMKLPLKVAGAALLSAISKLSNQFGVTDSKLQSDLSKMIGDVSKAFGLQKPSFGTIAPTVGDTNISISGGSNEQTVLASSLNQIAGTLAPTGTSQTSPSAPPSTPAPTDQQDNSQAQQSNNLPNNTNTSSQQNNNSGQTLTDRAREAGTPNDTGTVEPKPYVGGSSNILKPQSANIAMNSSTTNIAQGGPTSYQMGSDSKYSLKFNKEGETNYKISPSIQNSYDTLNAFSSFEYSPLSKNITQSVLANSSIQEQTDKLKFNPSKRLTPSSIAIAMGMTLPDDKTKLNASGISVVTLPAINRTRKQSVPDPETILVTGKPPSGLNGYNPYALVG